MTRRTAAIGLAVTIAFGLGSRKLHLGFSLWDKSLGDALYTVMIYFILALGRPTWRDKPAVIGSIALGLSLAIETFQLTGIPARMPRVMHWIFGTTFAWHDVACYFVGAIAATLTHLALMRRQQRRQEAGA